MKSHQGLYLGRHNSQNQTKIKLKYLNKKQKILHNDSDQEVKDTNHIHVDNDKSREYYLTNNQASQLGLSKVYDRLQAFSQDLSTLKVDQFEIAGLKVVMLVSPGIIVILTIVFYTIFI